MAPGEAAAVLERVGRLTLYAPVVRTSELRRGDRLPRASPRREHRPRQLPARPALDARPGRPRSSTSATASCTRWRTGAVSTSRPVADRIERPSSAGSPSTIPSRNEPDTDWSLAANRAWLADLRRPGQVVLPSEIPIVIGEETTWPGPATGVGLDPVRTGDGRLPLRAGRSDPRRPSGRVGGGRPGRVVGPLRPRARRRARARRRDAGGAARSGHHDHGP